jgi:chaperonin GroES
MKVVPLSDKVVVRPVAPNPITDGGLVLPENSRHRPQQGRVLSVGDGRVLADGTHAEPQVSEGDRILFPTFAGAEVVVDGQELLIMRENEILAVVD